MPVSRLFAKGEFWLPAAGKASCNAGISASDCHTQFSCSAHIHQHKQLYKCMWSSLLCFCVCGNACLKLFLLVTPFRLWFTPTVVLFAFRIYYSLCLLLLYIHVCNACACMCALISDLFFFFASAVCLHLFTRFAAAQTNCRSFENFAGGLLFVLVLVKVCMCVWVWFACVCVSIFVCAR